jgi:hypothetical protein
VAGRNAEACFQLGDVRGFIGVLHRFDQVVLFRVCWTKSVPVYAIRRMRKAYEVEDTVLCCLG